MNSPSTMAPRGRVTAVLTLTTNSLPVDVVDIDVDFDLTLAGDTATDLATAGSLPQSPMPQVTQMDPLPPQVTQMGFDLDTTTALAEPAPQVVQTYVQLDPPLLVDALTPLVTVAATEGAHAPDTV
ncbi:hypothetical protein ACFY2K_16545 [Kitasatospora sp. NPDC001309]|uniref:hypothetical protein n=1 Tax=Kitasatospora sp. NPDC001309 TaxID=3364013 RepID=UPI0036C72E39